MNDTIFHSDFEVIQVIQNPNFQPNPWDLGTPKSWDCGHGGVTSLGGVGMLRQQFDEIPAGQSIQVSMFVENPDASELAVAVGDVTYDGSPTTGELVFSGTLTEAASAINIRDVSGEGSVYLTDVRVLLL